MEFITEFFSQMWGFVEQIPDLINQLMVKIGAWFVIAMTKAKIAFIGYSWAVAQELINQLSISSAIESAWSNVDSEVMGYLTWLKIPEALNMLFNAYVTRYVMDVLK